MPEERLEPKFVRKDLHIPSLVEAREILGGRLPSIFEKYDFPESGIVLTPDGPKVPVYVASGLGFSYPGKYFLDHNLHPRLRKADAFILDPFTLCGEFTDPTLFDQSRPLIELIREWRKFNSKVIDTVNYKLAIPRAGLVFAVCEGYPIDEGMSSEVAYAATNFCPVAGVRSDFRMGENVATGTNPAVRGFCEEEYGGLGYFENPLVGNAYKSATLAVKQFITSKLTSYEKRS